MEYQELFDTARYNSITSILNIELSNLITKDEEDRIKKEMGEKFTEVVKMSPAMAAELRKSIDYLNEKKLLEIKEEGKIEGKIEGRVEAEAEIFEIFSELLEEGYDKDHILKEASKRLNRNN